MSTRNAAQHNMATPKQTPRSGKDLDKTPGSESRKENEGLQACFAVQAKEETGSQSRQSPIPRPCDGAKRQGRGAWSPGQATVCLACTAEAAAGVHDSATWLEATNADAAAFPHAATATNEVAPTPALRHHDAKAQ